MVGGGRLVVDGLNNIQMKDNDHNEVQPYTLGWYAGGAGW